MPRAHQAAFRRRKIFQPLEKNFPIIGKNRADFPTIGKIFSNHWKKRGNFFQSLENWRKIFPIVGKLAVLLLLLAAPPARADLVIPAPPERKPASIWEGRIHDDIRDWPLPCQYVLGMDPRDGGTLSGVARLFYGDGGKWPVIWEANKDAVPDPDRPKSGISLVIPALAEGAAP